MVSSLAVAQCGQLIVDSWIMALFKHAEAFAWTKTSEVDAVNYSVSIGCETAAPLKSR